MDIKLTQWQDSWAKDFDELADRIRTAAGRPWLGSITSVRRPCQG